MRQGDGCGEGALLHLTVDIQLIVQSPAKQEEEETLTGEQKKGNRGQNNSFIRTSVYAQIITSVWISHTTLTQ